MIRQKTVLIISGTVGAGKTTLSYALLSFCKKYFLRVCYKRFVAFSLFSYVLFVLMAHFVYGYTLVKYHTKRGIHPSTLVVKRLKKIPGTIVHIILLAETISLSFSLFRMMLLCRRKDVILVDEGPINAIANYLEILGSRAKFLILLMFLMLSNLARKFDMHIFFLDADASALYKRWIKRGYPKETSIIRLDDHLRYINLIRLSKRIVANYFKVNVLDARDTLLTNLNNIVSTFNLNNVSSPGVPIHGSNIS